jgi:hypothetical protein
MDGVVGDCPSPQIIRRGTSDFTAVERRRSTPVLLMLLS